MRRHGNFVRFVSLAVLIACATVGAVWGAAAMAGSPENAAAEHETKWQSQKTVVADLVDRNVMNGDTYKGVRAVVSRVRLTVSDFHRIDENGYYHYADKAKPDVVTELPKDWPARWTLTAKVSGPVALNKYEFHSDDKLFSVSFELESKDGALVNLSPGVAGNGLAWRKIFRIRADGVAQRYQEGRGR